MFSNLVFSWVLLLASPDVYLPQDVFQILVILFSCDLAIQTSCNGLSIPIFYFIFFPLHPVVGLSLCILHWFVGRFFFCYFGSSCFVCIAWPWYLLSFSSFSKIFWFISSSCIVRLVCCCLVLVFSFQWFFVSFSFLSTLTCSHNFLISPFSLIFHSGFSFLLGFLMGLWILLLTSFAPA